MDITMRQFLLIHSDDRTHALTRRSNQSTKIHIVQSPPSSYCDVSVE